MIVPELIAMITRSIQCQHQHHHHQLNHSPRARRRLSNRRRPATLNLDPSAALHRNLGRSPSRAKSPRRNVGQFASFPPPARHRNRILFVAQRKLEARPSSAARSEYSPPFALCGSTDDRRRRLDRSAPRRVTRTVAEFSSGGAPQN